MDIVRYFRLAEELVGFRLAEELVGAARMPCGFQNGDVEG